MNTSIERAGLNRREGLLAMGAAAVGIDGLSGLQAAEHHSHGKSAADPCAKACADSMVSWANTR